MRIEFANKLTCLDVPLELRRAVKTRLTFQNPKWIENKRLGYWNGETPKEIRGYQDREGVLTLTRGFGRQLLSLCNQNGIRYQVTDKRRTLPEVDFHFEGRLIQCIGRALRPAHGKSIARVFDYIDERVPVLGASAKARRRVYERLAAN